MIPPLILDTGEVIRVEDPTMPAPPTAYVLERIHHRARRAMAGALLRPAPTPPPAPFETDGRKHPARWWSGPIASWRRVTGRP